MLIGKQGVCAWLQAARLESIKKEVLSGLGFDCRIAKERRKQKTDGTWRTETKGRSTQDEVSWEELDRVLDIVFHLGAEGFQTCRRARLNRGGRMCPYCEFERRWEAWLW